jgi:hypothetical protein
MGLEDFVPKWHGGSEEAQVDREEQLRAKVSTALGVTRARR